MSLEDTAKRIVERSEIEGQRARGWMTPNVCGTAIGVTGEFIRGEIKCGRIAARVLTRDSGRTVYRIDPDDFDAYVKRYWPRKVFHGEQQPTQQTDPI